MHAAPRPCTACSDGLVVMLVCSSVCLSVCKISQKQLKLVNNTCWSWGDLVWDWLWAQTVKVAVMLSLKTVFCLKTILRQFSRCLGLGIAVSLVFPRRCWTFIKSRMVYSVYCIVPLSFTEIRKYVKHSNYQPRWFYADEQTNVFASQEYAVITE